MINLSVVDNIPRSVPGASPFYEVYFLKFHLLEEGMAFWIRYTLHAPVREEPYGALWAFALEEKEGGLLIGTTHNFPMAAVRMGAKDFYLKMGEAEISEKGLKGKVERDGFSMEWDLEYGEGSQETGASIRGGSAFGGRIREGETLKLYPYDWMYRGPFPKTKYLVPHPSARFSGRVRVGEKEYHVKSVPGEQAHIWGREHAQRWAWVHCNTFLEDPTALVEGLSAQIKIGPFQPPPFRVFCLRLGEIEYPFHSPRRWFRQRSRYDLTSWEFDAIEGDYRLMGQLTSDPKKVIGVRYTDPNGTVRICNHAEWAELRLGLYEKKAGRWEEKTSLHSRAASFEVVDLEPDPRVEVKVLG